MKAHRLAGYAFLPIALACRSEPPAEAAQADTLPIWAPTVIENVRVFDGLDVVESATVVIADGSIRQLATRGEDVSPPVGAVFVDGSDKTLLPGLIDAHTHTGSRGQLKNSTGFGVTAHLDMFTDVDVVAELKREQQSGSSADRPDLFSAATLVTATGGHGTQYGTPIPTLEDPEAAAAFVDERLAEGADYIKIVMEDGRAFGMPVPTLDEATLQATIDAAHARGVLAVVHVGSYEHARVAIGAGADGLVHISADQMPDDDFGRFAAEAGVFVVPTLTVISGTAPGEGPGGRTLVADPVIGPRLWPSAQEYLLIEFPTIEGNQIEMRNAYAAVRLLHEAGVPVLVGSDAPNPGTWFGASVHREMELLVDEVGLTPLEALRAATSGTARAFRLEDWRGRIVEGGRADVVLVSGDPTTDILATRAVEAIWKEGRRWKLDLFFEDVARLRAEGN